MLYLIDSKPPPLLLGAGTISDYAAKLLIIFNKHGKMFEKYETQTFFNVEKSQKYTIMHYHSRARTI